MYKTNKYLKYLLLIFLLSVILSATVVSSGAVNADEPETVTVRVGYYENEVFQEGAQDGTVKTGYAYEYYRKLSEYTGWKYEYVYGGFGDLYQMLLDGEIDLLAGLAWREERASLIGYPKNIMGHESYYLVKHDSDTSISADPATMNGCRIGVLDSAMVGVLKQYLSENDVKAEVVTYADYTQLFSAFDSKKVDILAAESDGAHGREHAEVLTVFVTSDYYLCVNKDRKDILEELNSAQALLAAEEPNYLNSLSAKYYSVSVTALAFSKAERDWMDSHNTLRVGYLENYLPYSDTDDQGEVTGIVKDIIPAILKSVEMQDMTVIYTGYKSYDDMIAGIGTGDIDVAFPVGGGLYYSEENGIYQSNAVSSTPAELIYLGDFSEKTTSHFAVNENNRMQYYFVRTNYPDAEITMYPSAEDCLSAVLEGKVGCATLNGLRANGILKNREYEDLSQYQTSYNDTRSFGVEIGNEGLLKLLNRGLNVLGSDYAQSIFYRYTGGLYSYDFVDVLRDHLLLFSLIIFAVVALIVFLLVRDMLRSKKEIREKDIARKELEEKNIELAASQKALSDALITAEHANSAKTAFLNNMSHDMRTPMNAIVGFTALAESHIDDKARVQDYLGKISVSSQHLLSLINDVLDMSRIESGNVVIRESEVHLPEVIHDLQIIVQSDISSKQIELSIETQNVKHEDIIADKLRLEQVLLNILTNAVKFTPAGGAIHFHISEKPSSSEEVADYEFRIKDNGIGMSEEFQKNIFDAFTRERTSTISGIQGTGLGMAITKTLVEMMGGTISLNSTEGKGSEFVVHLPCRISNTPGGFEPTQKRKVDAATGEELGEDLKKGLKEEANAGSDSGSKSGSKSESEKNAGHVMPDLTGKRVLLAEDNEMNRMIAEAILTESGLTVEMAVDGLEALEMMQNAPAGYYDIILMDIQMPRMDGYEAAKNIRALTDKQKASIPIVAVTANAFDKDRIISMEAGMNGHLAKPYDVPAIMEMLKKLLLDAEEQ